MKVLLCEDIARLGWLGDIVEVREGYARNYLLPQGLATEANEVNIRRLANEKASRAEQRITDRKRLEDAAKAVNGAEAVIAAKANEQGHLFGSVTAADIALNLREQGFAVPDEVVKLDHHIKQVGTTDVSICLAEDLTATVQITVVPKIDEEAEETK